MNGVADIPGRRVDLTKYPSRLSWRSKLARATWGMVWLLLFRSSPRVPIIFSGRPELKPTFIEADAWIGCGAILMAGVRIGRRAIVAAGAVVTKKVPPYESHSRVPARRISERFSEPGARETDERMLAEPPRRREFCPPLQLNSHARPLR